MADAETQGRSLVAVTAGDPAGIGPEIVVGALRDPSIFREVRPLVVADRAVLARAAAALKAKVDLNSIGDPSEGRYEAGCLDVLDAGALAGPIPYGQVCAEGGRAGYAYLQRAIDEALAGRVDGVTTAPLNKESLKAARVPHIDHTEALAARAALRPPMTLFLVRTLRIFFLTRHMALRRVPEAVTEGAVLKALPLCDLYLRQLGVEQPRIAVAALNPHGGEQGLFGTEEKEAIAPAVARARASGLCVCGPVPADAVFHLALEGRYDGVLSLYHDQGHIAAKTLSFHGTVSLTMGLQFLRTSVDHGTAFDIAGRGVADARGMAEAIRAAGRYARPIKARLHLVPHEIAG